MRLILTIKYDALANQLNVFNSCFRSEVDINVDLESPRAAQEDCAMTVIVDLVSGGDRCRSVE